MDVAIDTDILSTLIKLKETDLLHKLFPASKILFCPAVYSEIHAAVKLGILDSVPAGFFNVELTSLEKSVSKEMTERTTLGVADIECLAVAKARDCLLLSNDRQVGNEASSIGLDHLSLPLLLRELWRTGAIPKTDVAKLIDEIESKDRIVIKNKSLILK